jgi:hypothetical protein
VAGVDYIKGIIEDADDTLSAAQCQAIKQSLSTITDTNAFMLMTINRCIDYAKATKGIKLVPRLETIDLLETLQLPTCMRNVQDRVSIEMDASGCVQSCDHRQAVVARESAMSVVECSEKYIPRQCEAVNGSC